MRNLLRLSGCLCSGRAIVLLIIFSLANKVAAWQHRIMDLIIRIHTHAARCIEHASEYESQGNRIWNKYCEIRTVGAASRRDFNAHTGLYRGETPLPQLEVNNIHPKCEYAALPEH